MGVGLTFGLRREPQNTIAGDPAVESERTFDLSGNLGRTTSRHFADARASKEAVSEVSHT